MNPDLVTPTVIILDDEPIIRETLQARLEQSGYNVLSAGSYQEFRDTMTECDVVLCDILLPDDNRLQALKWSRQNYPHTPVVIMTGKPSYETAAEAIRLGAYDYLAKPVHKDELLTTLARALTHRRLTVEKNLLERENEAYRLELEQRVEEKTQALRESEAFLTNVTETMADAVFCLTLPDYRITYINRAAAQIFGYQAEELLGQTIEILHPNQKSFETFIQKQVIDQSSDQDQVRLEQLLRCKDGRSIWTEIATTFVYNDQRQPFEIISVVRDISQRSLLLSIVAHELRAPLALLTGFSEILSDDITSSEPEGITKYLEIVNRIASRMVKMLDELLDVTTIELGGVSLDIDRVKLNKLLDSLISDYSYLALKKNITIKADWSSKSLICQCDPMKVSQVVSNFIDNAIKFSPEDTTIELMGRQKDKEIFIAVKDEGPGIKPEEMQYLFQGFGHMKVSSKPTAGEKSTGLGLVICKKIIETHGGQIGVTSSPGQGSTFWFTLPVKSQLVASQT